MKYHIINTALAPTIWLISLLC